ncbi:aliphatic sulfonate ABC transporter substrate-binding protein [Rothia aerolata]|uniref:Putative aliphatic sulfonates-binding protein n=1 Tax=Rothia aerolata TaxID=1812262 RepID=A0A917IWI1_9MICC|nr:aliphatic sulfonate ABC transporter substrate-binding protein [Rothia aerolata]GGH64787.1 ABC transporter substrate-binding protein [Rothia aerolata]
MTFVSKLAKFTSTAAVATLTLTGCVAGEGSGNSADNAAASGDSTVTVDYATYNPLSLIIKEKGWLETALEDQGKDLEWVNSAGSNKANEALRSGNIDVGSTAGSAALLARANGSPIQVIDLYSQPEWSALVTTENSDIDSVEDLAGKSVAVTKGTDPYFLLLQALDEAEVSADDVTIENLQHADGRTALDNGEVDAWSGLDPIMGSAEVESSDRLFYRNLDFNTYGFLNATEDFISEDPEAAQTVVDVYAYARDWALNNQEEALAIFTEEAGITPETAKVVWKRTHLDIDPVPGDQQISVLKGVGPILVESGDVASQDDVDNALESIVEPKFAEAADASKVESVVE